MNTEKGTAVLRYKRRTKGKYKLKRSTGNRDNNTRAARKTTDILSRERGLLLGNRRGKQLASGFD